MYANFPWVLKDQGFIAKAAYSLFLNSEEATSGTIIFGGIDNAKIDGALVELPGAFPRDLGVQGDSITIDGTVTNIGQAIVLDSGTSYSSLPGPVVDAIAAAMNGTDSGLGFRYTVPCTQPDKNITFTLGNGKQTIQVPYTSFVIPQPGDRCNMTLSYSVAGDGYPMFADDILRDLYVVFDIEDNKISIGQAKYTAESDIVPIE